MRKFNNWENVKAAGDFVALPAGGYIANHGCKRSDF